MLKTTMIRSALVAFACALSVAAHAYASDPKQFDVPAGDLTAALETLARQSGMELVYQSEQVKGFRTKGVTGTLTPEEAVTKLLENTPLTFRKDASGAMLIAPLKSSISLLGEGEAPAVEGGTALPLSKAAAPASSGEKRGWFERIRLAQNDQDQASSSSSKDEKDNQNPPKDSDERMGEVIVTAQKREERLQDVPISISVLSGDDLDKSTLQGITEALSRVPGVSTFAHTQGGGTFVSVRGVAAGAPVFTGSSPISYYLDTVPFGLVRTAIAPDANAYDLERVEVLRGPQGTLYGASAQNGVVRVLTKDANLDALEFKVRTSGSTTDLGGENYRGDMAVNVPIVEGKLAARMVVGYQDWGGWIDQPIGRDMNDSQIGNARLKLNAQPTDELSIGLFAWLSRTDVGGVSGETRDGQRNTLTEESISTDYDVYGLKIGYDLPGVSIISTTSYLDYSNGSGLDIGGGISPFPVTTDMDADVFSQEVVLNSTYTGPWRWSIGGMYRDAEDRLYQTVPAFGFILQSIDGSRSSAIFGELGWRLLNDKLELTLGARYFEDDVESKEGPDATFALPGYHAENTFTSTTPRAVLTWHPNAELTVYGSFSEGFRSGAPQAYYVTGGVPGFPPIKPDKLDNYEIGAKGNLWGDRVTFGTALFYIDWQDVQQSLLVPSGTGNIPVTAVVNAESASGVGFEFGVNAQLARGLELNLNASWNDLEFDSDVISGGLVLFAKGDRPNFSPEYTAGAALDYVVPLGGSGYEGRFSTSANYTSVQGWRLAQGGQVAFGAGDPMLIARASFSIRAPEHWEATLFADNLNNERDAMWAAPSLVPSPNAVRVRPRTIGVQLDYLF